MQKKHPLVVEVGPLLRSEIGSRQAIDTRLDTLTLDDLGASKDLELHLGVSKIDEELLELRGSAEAIVSLDCDRCLRSFDHKVVAEFDELYARRPEIDQWPISGDGTIDLSEPLRQQLLLALPTHPLCEADCPGLCQICGKERRVCHHQQNRDTLSPEIKVSKPKE